jgi:pimeloyl-ACP methyl ester carboxylesterase
VNAGGTTKGTRVLRRADWALPVRPVHREVLTALPDPVGDRPPLLFVHGMGHGAWCFAEHWLLAAADRGYPAYALSLRGHGGSGGARRLGRTLMRDYVHDVVQTAVSLPRPPVLVGHSMGGAVVQLVLERYPAPAGVLLAPAPLEGGLGALAAIARDRPTHALRALAGRSLPMTADALFEGLDDASAQRFADRCGRESPLVQYEVTLRRRRPRPVRAPVLVVGTPDDRYVPLSVVRSTAARYGVEPLLFPGMGHDLMLDKGQDRVLSAVLDWVGRTVR